MGPEEHGETTDASLRARASSLLGLLVQRATSQRKLKDFIEFRGINELELKVSKADGIADFERACSSWDQLYLVVKGWIRRSVVLDEEGSVSLT